MASQVACPNCFALYPLAKVKPGRQLRCGECDLMFTASSDFLWEASRVPRVPAWLRWALAVGAAALLATVVIVFWADVATFLRLRDRVPR